MSERDVSSFHFEQWHKKFTMYNVCNILYVHRCSLIWAKTILFHKYWFVGGTLKHAIWNQKSPLFQQQNGREIYSRLNIDGGTNNLHIIICVHLFHWYHEFARNINREYDNPNILRETARTWNPREICRQPVAQKGAFYI